MPFYRRVFRWIANFLFSTDTFCSYLLTEVGKFYLKWLHDLFNISQLSILYEYVGYYMSNNLSYISAQHNMNMTCITFMENILFYEIIYIVYDTMVSRGLLAINTHTLFPEIYWLLPTCMRLAWSFHGTGEFVYENYMNCWNDTFPLLSL